MINTFLKIYMQISKTKAISLLMIVYFFVVLSISHANPDGGVVAEGQALITSGDNQVIVKQETARAIIDWQNFNIAPQEQTKFIQPDSNSVALNRIHSNEASAINGQLTANGKLILINQNGILFGKSSVVDVNGLLATTANINNETFMKQTDADQVDYLLGFDQIGDPNSKIINDGQINATDGLVGLVAPKVINNGTIIAKTGKVKLASGETFTLDLYGDNLINIAVAKDLDSQLVFNTGEIVADGSQIVLTAASSKQIVNSLIVNSGALKARSVLNKNGEIIIMAEGSNAVTNNDDILKGIRSGSSKIVVNGIIDASGIREGEAGGNVKLLADQISLLKDAVINVSGHTGKSNTTVGLEQSVQRLGAAGGEILIGGDYLGKGEIPAAIGLNVEQGATIYSDSIETGDAGRIILWSDGTTIFNGTIYARSLGGISGSNSGDGGFVEISGSQNLIATGRVDLSAAQGAIGTYLLDPSSIAIFSNTAVLDPTASQQLSYDIGGTGITEINVNYLTDQNASISLLADNIIIDLNGDTLSLSNNQGITIEARNSMKINSAGSIVTDGGNIKITLTQGGLDLRNLDLQANNNGSVKVYVVNGGLTLGNVGGASYFEAKAYNYLFGDVFIPLGKHFNAKVLEITAYRNLLLDLQGQTLTVTSPGVYFEGKKGIEVISSGTLDFIAPVNEYAINVNVTSKYSIDFTSLNILFPNFDDVISTINFTALNGAVTLGDLKAQTIKVNASGPNGNMVWSNNGKILDSQAFLISLANAMTIDFENNHDRTININDIDCNCDKLNFINVPASGGVINAIYAINFNVTQGDVDFSNVVLTTSDSTGSITLINNNDSIIIGSCTANSSINIHSLGAIDSNIVFSPKTQFNSSHVQIYTNNYASNIVFDLQDNNINLPIASVLSLSAQKGGSIKAISPGTITALGATNISIFSDRYNSQSEIDLGNLTFNGGLNNNVVIDITNEYGSVTLGNINASSLIVKALGKNSSNITIPLGKQITTTGVGKSLILVAEGNFINQNQVGVHPLNVSNVASGGWVVYFSGNSNTNQGVSIDYLGNYTLMDTFNYSPATLPTKSGNWLLFAPSLIAKYEDRNVSPLNGQTKKVVTVSGNHLNLIGIDAHNYSLVFDDFDSENNPIIIGNVGKIDPRPVTAVLSGDNLIHKIYDATVSATLTNDNYETINNIISGDNLYLTNNTKGKYSHPQADPNGQNQGVTATALTLAGNDVNNYVLAFNSAYRGDIGHIYSMGITVTLVGTAEKIYDGSTVAQLKFDPSGINSNYSFSGIAEGDLGTLQLNNYSTGVYDDKNVGHNKMVTVSGLTLSGYAADNYYMDSTAYGHIGIIEPRTLYPVFIEEAQVTKTYDGNTSAHVQKSEYQLQGLVGSDNVVLKNQN